jgi:hypothetical protein
MPFFASCSRTSGRLAIIASTRALGFPELPPQAPQSSAASNGLFSELLPWPQKNTSRAKFRVSPITRRTVSTVKICSLKVKPVRVIRSMRAKNAP